MPLAAFSSMTKSLCVTGVLVLSLCTFPVLPVPASAQDTPASKGDDVLAVQVLVARAGFSPGEIDGRGGSNTSKAAAAFEKAAGTSVAEALQASTAEPTVTYVITSEDAAGPFTPDIPDDIMEKAKLDGLHYRSLLEALGERFHASPALLERLNPSARFVEGEEIRVPNVKAAPVEEPPAKVTVTVSKKTSVLTVAGPDGDTIFHAPVTTGSERDPLPIGEWEVTLIAKNPTYNYNPDLFWDSEPGDAKATIPAGPNGPVGVVWIGLSKEHYGLHGTPEPQAVGHTASHGCVRLTNWDAMTLAALVREGTVVLFVE